MPIRLSGMVSGLDTDSIVKELVSAYSNKKEKIVKNKTKLEWKQDVWKEMNAKIYNFYSNAVSKLRFSSAYSTKKSTSSDESIASVTAGSGAVVGTQTLFVSSLAKSSYLTGDKVSGTNGKKLSASSKLSELGITSDTTIRVKAKSEENPNGKETEITLSADMKISDLTKALKDAGVSANFDTTNQRFYISALKSGADYDFDIMATDANGVNALKNMGIYTLSDEQKQMYQEIANWDAEAMKTTYKNKLSSAKEISSAIRSITSGYEMQYMDYQKLLDYHDKLAELKEDADNGDADAQTEYAQFETEYNTLASNYGLDPYNASDVANQKSAIEAKQQEIAAKYSGIKNNNGVITLVGIKEETLQEECKALPDSDPRKKALASIFGAVDENGDIKKDEDGNIQFGKMDMELMQYAGELQDAENAYRKDIANSKANYEIYNEMKNLLDTAGGTPLTGSDLDEYNEYAKIVGMDAYSAGSEADALNKISTEMTAIEEKFTSITSDGNGGFIFVDKSTDPLEDIIDKKVDEYKTNLDNQIAFAKDQINGSAVSDSKVVKVDGQDAKIQLNGVDYTSNTNSFNINGLTITAKKTNATEDAAGNVVPGSDPVIIDTASDTEGVYNTIKDFLKQYNELMIAMDTAYNADSASKYEPLTDEEKDAMSEKEVEKWEQKIKDSLLRRDSTLNSVSSAMRNVMRGSYSINGKDYSLSTFGIKTLGYFTSKQNERNAYHIDGDPDDTNVALNSDKLKAAIADDPDAVMEFFQKLSTDMYSTLTEKMKSTKLSSAYTVYNDKQMKTEYEAYEKDIKRWEEKIAAMEDKYYKQFAAMETALSKLQSSTASLTSLLGGGA